MSILTATSLLLLAADPISDAIKVCQVGYLPEETKIAILTAPVNGPVTVRNAKGQAVATVTPSAPRLDPDSGDTVQTLDFTSVTRKGVYYLDAPGVGVSYRFTIAKDAYAKAFRAAIRSYYGQRCGIDVNLAPDFPDFHYTKCHDAASPYHASAGKTGTRDATGGWHDAGDYGKYVVNSGITTGTLLWTYEFYGPKLRKLNLNIPESGNGTPDFLNEVKWNLDWMLKMQDEDGGVWHKATTAWFPGFILPAEDKNPVYIVGTGKAPFKNTTATADLAAVAAIAARVYRPFNRAYADKCLTAARRAWTWVQANPNVLFTDNPAGISTGGYGDSNAADERLWAAAELFRTTGETSYGKYVETNLPKTAHLIRGDAAQGWPEVQNLALYTYALAKKADPTLAARIRTDALQAADDIVVRTKANGYRQPLKSTDYYWGSNAVVANYGVMLLVADHFRPTPAYRYAAFDALHYLLGRNTFNTSFVTQVGSKWAMNPHHRPSAADKVTQPWPGLLVGGPNADGKKPFAKQWHDEAGDYRTNEIAINWNAPLVFILAGGL